MDEKKISKKILLKSGFWYTISSFLTRAMVFITMPIFTRIMTKSEYGDFSVFASWQAILLIVCGIEVYATLNRARFDFVEKNELDGYITSSLVLSSMLTGLVFLLYIILPNIFNRLFLLDKKYMLVMFAYLFTYPALSMFQAKQRVTYNYKLSASISFILTISSSVLAVVLTVIVQSDRLFGRIIGQYGLTIIVGMCFYLYFLHCSRHITAKAWRYALRIGLPLVFSYIGNQILLSSDNLVLKHMCSAEAVSTLSVTHTCSHIMLILVQTLNTAWAPWFYDMLKIGNTKEIKKTYQMYLWMIIVSTFAVLLIGPEIIYILGGADYRDSMYLLPAYILCGIFSVLTAQFVNLEIYYKKPEYAAMLTAAIAVINVLLNIWGVNLWGYRAVCYTTVFCQLLLIGLHYYITKRMNIRDILPLKTMILALFTTVGLIPVSLLLYQSNIMRYSCIFIVSIIVVYIIILKRKALMSLIFKIKN